MKNLTIITKNITDYGGIERFVCSISSALSDYYNVRIISLYADGDEKIKFPLNPKIPVSYLIPQKPGEVSMLGLIKHPKVSEITAELKRRKNINSTLDAAAAKYFKNLKTDVILTDRALVNSLVQKYYHGKAKLIASDHDFHQNSHRYIAQLKKSIKGFDYLVVATKELADYYQKHFKNIQCVEIPNSIDDIPSQKAKINHNALVSVGRLSPEKDFATLIRVVKLVKQSIPDVKLTIVGDGKEREMLETAVRTNGLSENVTITGFLPQDEVQKQLLSSSLYVMTSKTEAFGIVLLEAMSTGLPTIAFSRASGARNIIKNGKTGFLIDNSDETEMANKIIELLQNKKTLRQMQEKIAQEIDQYSTQKVAQRWVKLVG